MPALTNSPIVTVDAPAQPVTLGLGLYGAANVREVPRGVAGGVEMAVPRLGGHGLWNQSCEATNPDKAGGDTPAMSWFPGTGVWAMDDCHPLGGVPDNSAAATLLRTEQGDVEAFLAPVMLGRATAADSLGAAIAMFTIEGLVPVVHVSPSMLEAMVLSRAVYQAGGRWVHVLGAGVVVGAGYQGLLTGPVVTGPLGVYRSPVLTHESFNVSTNTRAVLAERTVAVTWLGPSVTISGSGND